MYIKNKVDFFNNINNKNTNNKNNTNNFSIKNNNKNNINDKISYWKSINEKTNTSYNYKTKVNNNKNENETQNEKNITVLNKINNIGCKVEYNKLYSLNDNYEIDNDSENEDEEHQTNLIINY